jgi:hypothetical protein
VVFDRLSGVVALIMVSAARGGVTTSIDWALLGMRRASGAASARRVAVGSGGRVRASSWRGAIERESERACVVVERALRMAESGFASGGERVRARLRARERGGDGCD